MSARFFVCDHCGNLITTLHDAGVPMLCCGEKLRELIPNTVEASGEKHLPVVEIDGRHVTVKVGSIFHPMTEEHSIGWVCLVTKAGCTMRICLSPDCEPVAHFTLEDGDSVKAAYAYCNLHGFWKTEI